MKGWLVILLVVLLAVVAVVAWPEQARSEADSKAAVYTSPINGGCYIAAPNDCRLHVDPFTINVVPGQRLVSFKLQANGVTIYDFSTDVSNPPPTSGSTYTPSLVMQDFAAICGRTYVLNLIGRDSGDSNFLNMGQTTSFTCPAGVP